MALVSEKVVKVRSFRDYWELETTAGDKAYLDLLAPPNQLVERDWLLLQPSFQSVE